MDDPNPPTTAIVAIINNQLMGPMYIWPAVWILVYLMRKDGKACCPIS